MFIFESLIRMSTPFRNTKFV